MPLEFLLHANRSTSFVKERTIRVLEDVPADSLNPNLYPGGFQNLLLNHAYVVAAPGDVRRKDQPHQAPPRSPEIVLWDGN